MTETESAGPRRADARRRWARAAARRVASVAVAFVAATLAWPAASLGAETVVPDGGVALRGSTAEIQRGIDLAHDAGIRWVSLGARWESLEPERLSYVRPDDPAALAWRTLEERLRYASSRGMSVELRVNDAPGWASGRPGRADDPPRPANAGDYGAFLEHLAGRLGSHIDAYSPWNEPNLSNYWNPVDPEAYTAVQRIAYRSIKRADPTATVLSAPIVGTYPNAYRYLERAYAAGLRGSADAIGWNSYPHGEPESAYSDENGLPSGSSLPGQLYLGDLLARLDPGRRIWIMELSWSTCTRCTGFAANAASEAQQADYLRRAFTFRRRYLTGVTERIFWYSLRDEGDDPRNWEHRQGLLRRDFSPKPAFAALRSVGVEIASPGATEPPVAGPPTATPALLPPAALRSPLAARASSVRGRTAIGRPRLIARRGTLRLRVRITVRGGPTTVRVDGYRGRRWHRVTAVRIPRSGTVTLRFPDKAYLAIRMRATVPGRAGWRVARIVRVPKARRAVR